MRDKPARNSNGEEIEFWFDFSSAYAYFASLELRDLSSRLGCRFKWRPFMLGTAFKVTGARGLSSIPLKSEYAKHDWQRIARFKTVPFVLRPDHPRIALAATRIFYWVEQIEPKLAPVFAGRVFQLYYTGKLDTSNAVEVAAVVDDFGLEPARAGDAEQSVTIKELTKEHGINAVARGVFGSPFFFVGEEPFWGWDRIPLMEEWISRGGW